MLAAINKPDKFANFHRFNRFKLSNLPGIFTTFNKTVQYRRFQFIYRGSRCSRHQPQLSKGVERRRYTKLCDNIMAFNLDAAKITKIEPLSSDKAKWVKIQKINYIDPKGKERDWEFCSRQTRVEGSDCDGVGIIVILEKPSGKEILLQKQFRAPVNGVCIEIPAGLLDANESIEQCAERELHEETGYYGKAFHTSPLMFNDPGFCNTNMKLVEVHVDLNDERNKNPIPHLEESEFIETFSVPLKDLPEELESLAHKGYVLDARIQNFAHGIRAARNYL